MQNNQKLLATIKEIRNIFDTIGVEVGIASRNAIDMWANVLQNTEQAHPIGYAKNVLNKLSALSSLLYSIKVHAEKIIKEDASNSDTEGQ